MKILGVLVAAVVAFRAWPSYTLSFFAFVMVVHVGARGLPDIITDPNKVQRALFFTLYPVSCTAVLYLTYLWWGRMWLAVLLGLVVGGLLNEAAGAILFPKVYREEREDDARRAASARAE